MSSHIYSLISPSLIQYPLIKFRVPAGFPSPALDYMEKPLSLDEYLISNSAATYLMRVSGESMTGALIDDGDMLVLDKSLAAQHGDIVVAAVNGEFTVKRLYKQLGRVELHSENPKYPPIQFGEGDQLDIWAVVIGVVRRYGKKT